MATWTYYAHRSSDGEPVAELPLDDVSIENVLSGRDTLTASMALREPMAARAYCAPWLREITAVRDGVIAFHGPVIGRIPTVGNGRVQITAASPHAYLFKRVTEAYHEYDGDTFLIVRSLVTDATAKTGGDLYRLDVTATDSGDDTELTVGAKQRRGVSEVIEELAADNATPFDFRWDATWDDATQHLVQRTLTLDNPTIGRDLSADRVVEATSDLVDGTDSEDGMKVANRVHGLGGQAGTILLRSVSNSGSSLAAGYPLLEDVVDLSDVQNQALLDGITAHIRNNRLPGTRLLMTQHTISAHLPYGAFDLGDLVGINLSIGVEQINTARRVVAVSTTPASDQVRFTYFDPTDAT